MNIIGGGLAGAVLGLWALREGLSPRIFEATMRPSTTLCGEGVRRSTLERLRPVFDATPFIAHELAGLEWRFGPTRLLIDEPCVTMRREAWIPAMLDAFEDRGGSIEYGRRIDARGLESLEGPVVGCDGPGSIVRRRIGATVHIAIGHQMRVPGDGDRLRFLTTPATKEGYAWAFPRHDGINVGIVASPTSRVDLRAVAAWFGLAAEGRHERYPIATSGRMLGRGRFALLGDAGGMTNPVTKGGIAPVLVGAPILARALARGRLEDGVRALQRHPMMHPRLERARFLLGRHAARLPGLVSHLDVVKRRWRWAVIKTAARHPLLARHAPTLVAVARTTARWSW